MKSTKYLTYSQIWSNIILIRKNNYTRLSIKYSFKKQSDLVNLEVYLTLHIYDISSSINPTSYPLWGGMPPPPKKCPFFKKLLFLYWEAKRNTTCYYLTLRDLVKLCPFDEICPRSDHFLKNSMLMVFVYIICSEQNSSGINYLKV